MKTPETNAKLRFSYDLQNTSSTELQINILGLTEFWQNQTDYTNTLLEINFIAQKKQHENKVSLPFRGYRIKQYAVEFICWQIYKFLAAL